MRYRYFFDFRIFFLGPGDPHDLVIFRWANLNAGPPADRYVCFMLCDPLRQQVHHPSHMYHEQEVVNLFDLRC